MLSRGEIPKIVDGYIRAYSGNFKASDIFDYPAGKKSGFAVNAIKNIKQSIFKVLQRLVAQDVLTEVEKQVKEAFYYGE